VIAWIQATWRQYGRELASPGIDDDPEGRQVLVRLARAMAKARAFKGHGSHAVFLARVLEFIPHGALEMLSDYETRAGPRISRCGCARTTRPRACEGPIAGESVRVLSCSRPS